jgi:probable HAF family extracellular repeat protein
MEELGALPGAECLAEAHDVSADGSVVVGYSTWAKRGRQAFRWTEDDGMLPLGFLAADGSFSDARGVSADGSVVVGMSSSGGYYQAFRWTGATGMVGLGYLSGIPPESQANDVSGDGQIVVGSSNLGSRETAFIWDAARGMRSLQSVLTEEYGLDLTGWWLAEATAISADGKAIVGNGYGPAGGTEAWLAILLGPTLEVRWAAGHQISLRWPRAANGFRLEESAELAPADWTVVANAPTVVGDQNVVTVEPVGRRFYRLAR